MLGPLLSNLTDCDRVSYLSNEKQIEETEQALLSCSEVLHELEEKVKEARLRASDQTKTLHALYELRQKWYSKVFERLRLTIPKPKNLFHRMKKENVLRDCHLEKKVWGSKQFYQSMATYCPVYEETTEGMKQVSLQDAIQYWQLNLEKIIAV